MGGRGQVWSASVYGQFSDCYKYGKETYGLLNDGNFRTVEKILAP